MFYLLKPLSDWIKKLESNNSFVSDVFYAINDISSLLTLKLSNIEFLTNKKKSMILEFWAKKMHSASSYAFC